MRKILAFLLILTVLPTLAQPRHVNPEEVTSPSIDPQFLSSFYQLISSYIMSGNLTGSSDILNHLLNITAPPDIRYILSRFHELAYSENELLRAVYSNLKLARDLALRGDLNGSAAMLNDIYRSLAEANLTYIGLEDAAREVERRVGARASLVLTAIAKMIGNCSAEASDLNETVRLNLTKTELNLSSLRTEAWVGDSVQLFGSLRANGTGLADRKVIIVADGREVGSSFTDINGSFSFNLTVPYKYVPSILIYAIFIPNGSDSLRYRSSVSNNVTLKLKYITPYINISVEPGNVTPGGNLSVNISSSIVNLNASIYVFDMLIKRVLSYYTVIGLRVPDNISEGPYKILVLSEPSGVVGPGREEASFYVRKIGIKIDFNIPSYMLALIPYKAKICVIGEGNRSIGPYAAKLSISSLSMETLSNSTCTNLSFSLPPLFPSGSLEARVLVIPNGTEFRQDSVSTYIVAINPIMMLVALLIPIAALLAYRHYRRPKLKVKPKIEEVPEVPKAVEEKRKPSYSESLKSDDPVVKEYIRAVMLVEKATGIQLMPHHTISEYAKIVASKLGDSSELFQRLSYLAEMRLYSSAEVDPSMARSIRTQLELKLGLKLPSI
jgi:hypothetical protein